MRQTFNKIIAFILLASVAMQFGMNAQVVKAETTQQPTATPANQRDEVEKDLVGTDYKSGEPVNAFTDKFFAIGSLADRFTNSDSSVLRLDDLFSTNTKLIFKQTDYNNIRGLYCISKAFTDYPDYNNNMALLAQASGKKAADLEKLKGSSSVDDQATLRKIIRDAYVSWANTERIKDQLIPTRKGDTYSVENVNTLACVTGFTNNQINEYLRDAKQRSKIETIVSDALEGLKIDIRVIKTLVYLVTPQEQGGGGYYRIRVSRIFQHNPLSTESDAINGSQTATVTGGQTAATVGENQRSNATATVEDASGNTVADAFLTDYANEDNATSADAEVITRNASAHKDGQAVDISEVNDIRCTVIGRKRLHWFGNDDSVEQKPPTATKLAWQTTGGYAASGGKSNNFDIMDKLKSEATQIYWDFANELGADVSSYDGDLSQSDLGDIATLIGKSLFSQMINSPGALIDGTSAEDTMHKLGSMYIADYLGLPRTIFLNREIDSIDDLARIVGEAKIEKSLNVPFGMLEPAPMSPLVTKAGGTGQKLNSLDVTLQNIGRRKLAYEMNLKINDLEEFKEIVDSGENATLRQNNTALVGKKAIENALELTPGSFAGKNYNEVVARIGYLKAQVFTSDPGFIDRKLHLAIGETQKMVKEPNSTARLNEFISLVGTTRINDSLAGFKYLSDHDTAYQLPAGTWSDAALLAKPAALRTIGLSIVSRVFAADGSDEQKAALVGWIKGVLGIDDTPGKDKDNNDALVNNEPPAPSCFTQAKVVRTIKQIGTNGQATTKPVTISEDAAKTAGLATGDLCKLYGRKNGNSREVFERLGRTVLYYAFVNATANKKAVKASLDGTPGYEITNSDILFYTTRAIEVQRLSKKIQEEWEKIQTDGRLLADKELTDDLSRLVDQSKELASSGLSVNAIKARANKFSASSVDIKAKIKEKSEQYGELKEDIEVLHADIDELNRNVQEMIQGQVIPASTNLTQAQVTETTQNNTSTTTKLNPITAYMMIKGQIKPTDFFQDMAIKKIEDSLDLPANSLTYFLQDVKTRNTDLISSFFQAIGQAKIESTLSLPAKYFQGPIYKGMPDYEKIGVNIPFPTLNLAVTSASKTTYENLKDRLKNLNIIYITPASASNAVPAGWKIDFKASNVDYYLLNIIWRARNSRADGHTGAAIMWKELKKLAQTQYVKEQQEANLNGDKTMADVVANVGYQHLNDGLRTGSNDVAFRLGLTGSASAESLFSAAGWSIGNKERAAQIDALLGISPSSGSISSNTEALFTGGRVYAKDGQTTLTTEQKQSIEAALTHKSTLPDPSTSTTPATATTGPVTAITDRYLQLLNGEITLEEIQSKTLGSPLYNPYSARYQGDPSQTDPDSGCAIHYVSGTGPEAGFELSTNLENDSYVVVLADNSHRSFKTEAEAQAYINLNLKNISDYFTSISTFLYDLVHQDDNYILNLSTSTEWQNHFISPAATREYLTSYINNLYTDNSFNLLPFEEIINNINRNGGGIYNGGNPIVIAGIELNTLQALFGTRPATRSKPLQTYREAVGRAEAYRVVSWILLRNLGISVLPGDFQPEDLFAIINGDFRPLFKAGLTYIEDQLDLPKNTLRAIYQGIRKPADVVCALRNAGAEMVGKAFGLDYVRLDLNPVNFFDNLGRARIETVTGLPRNSARGQMVIDPGSRTGLLANVGYINFVLAYKIPTSIVSFPSTASIDGAAWDTIKKIWPTTYDKYKDLSPTDKLKLIRDNFATLGGNPDVDPKFSPLKTAILATVTNIGQAADARSAFWNGDTIPQTQAFIRWLDYLDGQLKLVRPTKLDQASGLPSSTTFQMLSGQMGVDKKMGANQNGYIRTVALKYAGNLAMDKILDMMGLDPQEVTAAKDLGTDLSCLTDINPLRIFTCQAHTQGEYRAAAFTAFEQLFHISLDKRIGLINGSMARVVYDPSQTGTVIFANAIQKFDNALHLNGEAVELTSAAFACDPELMNAFTAVDGTDQPETHTIVDPPSLEHPLGQRRQEETDASLAARCQQTKRNLENVTKYPHSISGALPPRESGQGASCNAAGSEEDKNLVNTFDWSTNPDSPEFAAASAAEQRLSEAQAACIQSSHNENKTNPLLQKGIAVGKVVVASLIKYWVKKTTKGTLDMPIGDVTRIVFEGDIQLLLVAIASYSANVFINTNDKKQCQQSAAGVNIWGAGSQPNECMIPADMQISYWDIRFAMTGDASMENDAGTMYEYNYLTGADPPDTTARPYGSTNLDNFTASLQNNSGNSNPDDYRTSGGHTNAASRDDTSIRTGTTSTIAANSGYTGPADLNAARLEVDRQKAMLESDAAHFTDDECLSYYFGESTPADTTMCDNAWLAQQDLDNMAAERQQGKKDLRQSLTDSLTYRTIDALLYKVDNNIYSGFAWDLVKGNVNVKLKALGMVLLTGFARGELFGQTICRNKEGDREGCTFFGIAPDVWIKIVGFTEDLIKGGVSGENILNSLIGQNGQNGLYSVLNNLLTEKSKSWLGFQLPADTLGAVLVGTFTGNWGGAGSVLACDKTTSGFCGGDLSNTYYKAGGISLPTVTTLVVTTAKNYIEQKVFAWADKSMGVAPGTVYKLYTLSRDLWKASRTLSAFSAVGADQMASLSSHASWGASYNNAVSTLSAIENGKSITLDGLKFTKEVHGDVVTWVPSDNSVPWTNDAMTQRLTESKLQQIKAMAITAVITFVVNTIIDKLFGEEFAKFDKSMGFVPGTTAGLVGIAVGVAVAYAVAAVYAAAGAATTSSAIIAAATNPWTIGLALLALLIMNLFSVYKYDVFCTADGFWPGENKDDAINIANNTVNSTGLGVWDGANASESQNYSVWSAQIRARQLIGSLLSMQYNPIYRDVIPNQIMTGRGDDIKYWNQLIDDNICKKMGSNYFAANGVCSKGDQAKPEKTRAGAWENPQATAFTHIGF